MLTLRLYRSSFDADVIEKFAELKRELGNSFRPLVSPALQTVADLFKVPPETLRRPELEGRPGEERRIADGEIFTSARGLLVMTYSITATQKRLVRRPDGTRTLADAPRTYNANFAIIAASWDATDFDPAMRRARELLGSSVEQWTYSSQRFDELKAEGREPPAAPTREESDGVLVIMDRAARTLATAIKASGGLLIKDAAKPFQSAEDKERVPELISKLKETKLIDSEVVVVCSKTSAQIARAPTIEAVKALVSQGIKCACGKSIAEEKIEEALTVTELARGLLDKARWLTILLQNELLRAGVAHDAILVEQSVGGDEVDCLANVSGELVLFELKDKLFNLGNAYSFGAKLPVIRPDHAVVVTTETVGSDAKDHFVRARLVGRVRDPDLYYRSREEHPRSDIKYIEGISNIRSGLEDLAAQIYRGDAERVLSEVLGLASVSGDKLLDAFAKACNAQRGIVVGVSTTEALGSTGRSAASEAVLQTPLSRRRRGADTGD